MKKTIFAFVMLAMIVPTLASAKTIEVDANQATITMLLEQISVLTREIARLQSLQNTSTTDRDSSRINTDAKESSVKGTKLDDEKQIMYWWGKVNRHREGSVWVSDPNGVSGADIDMLDYCKKWYPKTVSVKEHELVTTDGWHDRGNVSEYTSVKMSYHCVQPGTTTDKPSDDDKDEDTTSDEKGTPSLVVLTPNGGERFKTGDEVLVTWKTKGIKYNPDTQVDVMDDRIDDWTARSYTGTAPALQDTTLISSKGDEYVYGYKFTVPQNFNDTLPSQYQNIFGGRHYKVLVHVLLPNKSGGLQDVSDKAFTLTGTSLKLPVKILNSNGQNIVPRIAFASGKVHMHMNTKTGLWESDPAGVSDEMTNRLEYCKKWYPNTISVEKTYDMETIFGWKNAKKHSGYVYQEGSMPLPTDKCLQK